MRDRRASTKQQSIRRATAAGLERLEPRVLFAAGAYQQGTGATGLAVMEAEGYDANVAVGGKTWSAYTASGFAGAGALRAVPNAGAQVDTGYVAKSPRLDFNVNFTRTGPQYVWLRGLGATDADNSVHVGLDGATVATADRMTFPNRTYGWSNKTSDGPVATVNVTTPGVHTVNVWMREDGVVVDRVLLASASAYVPTGTGPAVSARAAIVTPTVTVGATDATAGEAAGDPGMVTFVRAGGGTSAPLTVRYAVGGSATNGADYASLGGTVTIPAGATSAAVNVLPVDDAAAEGPETVVFAVAADPAYAVGSPGSATVTIADDDAAVPPPPPPPPAGQTPFGGVARPVPAQVEAEDFDDGGEGVAYHDSTAPNVTGAYRSTAVDVEPCGDVGGGYAVGHLTAGEWLEYTVTVPAAGGYDVAVRAAAAAGYGGTLHVEVDGIDVTGPLALGDTGGWQAYATLTKAGVPFTAGPHVVRVVADAAAGGGDVGNLNWLRIGQPPVAPAPIQWQAAAPSPVTRSEAVTATVGGKMYVFGGFYNDAWQTTLRSDVYDPVADAWARVADLPKPFTHSAVAVVGTDVWLVGAYEGDHPGPGVQDVWRFDTVAGTWTPGPSLPEARGAGAAAVLGRTIHYFGGRNDARDVDEGTHWALDLDNAAAGWQARAALANPRNHLGGAAVGGYAYAIGGQHGEEGGVTVQTDVDRYDPATDRWTPVAALPSPRSQMGAGVVVSNGRIVVMGGERGVNVALAEVTAYDPAADAWAPLAPLPKVRRSGVASAVGNLLVFSTGWNFGQRAETWVATWAP